jgi:multidrug efflux pump subunit AcrB
MGQQELMGLARKAISDVPGVEKVIIQDLSLSGFSANRGFPVEFTLRGPDWDTLGKLSESLKKTLVDTGTMVDIARFVHTLDPHSVNVPSSSGAK